MRTKNAKRISPAESEHLAAVKSCISDGCARKVVARGMCQTHYMQERRAGNIESSSQTDVEFVRSRIAVTCDGCWEWKNKLTNGYGFARRNGRSIRAHRFSYEVHVGPIPAGMQINHACNNRCCVNPAHLYAGTQKQNMADMAAANRGGQPRGVRSGMAKINDEIAREILNSKEIARVVAARFSISVSLVYAIRKRLIWRHVNAQ